MSIQGEPFSPDSIGKEIELLSEARQANVRVYGKVYPFVSSYLVEDAGTDQPAVQIAYRGDQVKDPWFTVNLTMGAAQRLVRSLMKQVPYPDNMLPPGPVKPTREELVSCLRNAAAAWWAEWAEIIEDAGDQAKDSIPKELDEMFTVLVKEGVLKQEPAQDLFEESEVVE